MSSDLVVRCNAKINLYLNVVGQRDDGYHDIETVFQSVDLHDTLHLQKTSASGIEIVCDHPSLTDSKNNLVYRAAQLFVETFGVDRGATITIDKRIPLGGGLAGGSTDAAGTLRGLAELWSVDVAESELHHIAAQLGADVPFCLRGGTAAATGTGADLVQLDMPQPWWIVLVSPDVVVPTAEVYRRIDARGFDPQHERFEQAIESVRGGGLPVVLYNSMESVVFDAYPRVHAARDALRSAGAANVLMSGSGATVYAVVETEDQARHLANRIPPHADIRTIVCRTV